MSRTDVRSGLIPITDCSRCGYALTGLQASGVCPECGFPFDEKGFMLEGISRGVKDSMGWWRATLWILVAVFAVFVVGPGLTLLLNGSRAAAVILASILPLWVLTLVYLVWTGRSRRDRFEHYAFGPEGFGPYFTSKDIMPDELAFVRWSEIQSFQAMSIGQYWQRIRFGRHRGAGGKVVGVVLDFGFRGSPADLAELLERISPWLGQPDASEP